MTSIVCAWCCALCSCIYQISIFVCTGNTKKAIKKQTTESERERGKKYIGKNTDINISISLQNWIEFEVVHITHSHAFINKFSIWIFSPFVFSPSNSRVLLHFSRMELKCECNFPYYIDNECSANFENEIYRLKSKI